VLALPELGGVAGVVAALFLRRNESLPVKEV
jgi:hypothetical protein